MWALGWERARLELKAFFRNREAVVFNFSFPPMLLVLFASIFQGDEIANTGVDFRQTFVAGIIASGIMSSGFNSLAISIAIERHDGTLKRLAGTPMPKGAYFIGKLVMSFVNAAAGTAIMLTLGTVFYGLDLPSDARRWLVFAATLVLGTAACSLLGIAYSRLPRDGKSAPAVVTPPYIALQFISGVFFYFGDLSRGLQFFASLFPLRWMASNMRYVFLPDSFKIVEPGHSWHVVLGFGVMAAWMIGSFAIAARTFRWNDER
jgi:ABC-2 type transport system permease protein